MAVMSSARTWVVRADRNAAAIDDFRTKNMVAIGWPQAGPITKATPATKLPAIFEQAFPQAREGTRRVWLAQVRRFVTEMAVGDPVATYDPNIRQYLLGVITGELEWRPGDLPRVYPVRWTHQVARDALSIDTRYALGSIATLFRASDEASAEVWSKAQTIGTAQVEAPAPEPGDAEVEEETASETVLREEVVQKAQEFIEDRIAALDWRQMQDLVAGILRAMGYHTRVSPEGADRGVDIFASPDGLGLQEPRIFVEVKHRSGAMGADEIRSFLGGRRAGDRCLYVSTGGFTKDAKYEADRANVPLTLVTLTRLRELLVQHYENLDSVTRTLVPLERLYWPIA